MAYRATMSHRELSPSDEMRYYLKREVGDDLTLNMGTCALALEFDTQEMGTAHAFRVGADSGLNPDWELGTFCPTFRQFLDSFTPETNARMADFPDLEPLPDDQIRTLQQSQGRCQQHGPQKPPAPQRPACRQQKVPGLLCGLIVQTPEGQ